MARLPNALCHCLSRSWHARSFGPTAGSRVCGDPRGGVGSANELVTKGDLMGRIWPGAIVEESTLYVHTSAIRKALGPIEPC